ncbi:Retrovirus-related Pol polyprotein from transposon RE1 [Vitis vinifera]|uniref:Retrovirus-related Pol polyprotein from transposon RE1 n=1 Tax=Vitis vinifera TaxID=29760 RepID=A0A438C5M3_VITVI|nr:Retrovirus-related Pol polyprotein from transposon RE1 [Vitis vinifera]
MLHQDFSHGIRAEVQLAISVCIKKLKIINSSFLSQSFLQNMATSIHSSNQQIGVTPTASATTNVLHQVLNHSLLIKLDRTNYILWRTQMENIVFANGFKDHVEGLKPCPSKETSSGTSIQNSYTGEEKIFSASSRERIMQLRFEFQTTQKRSLSMMEYILKLKMITDNLAAIGEPISERDQELQFLSGLGVEYNPIVASITAREYDLPLQSVHSILLTHEQLTSCNYRFDIDFKGPENVPPKPHVNNNNKQALMASPTADFQEAWFLDTGATHHLSHNEDNLQNTYPYQAGDKVAVGNAHQTNLSSTSPAAAPSTFTAQKSINKTTSVCCACQLSKSHKLPFSPASSKASTPLELIHANLWGPAPISSTIGVKYFLLLLDDFSRYSWIYEGSSKPLLHFLLNMASNKDFLVLILHSKMDELSANLDIVETGLTLLTTASMPLSSGPMRFRLLKVHIFKLFFKGPQTTIPLSTDSIPSSSPTSSTSSIPYIIQVPFAESSNQESSTLVPVQNTHPMTTPSKDADCKSAMDTKYHALLKNNTWTLVPPPPHANIIGCKWVFKLKHKPDGNIDRCKARLVAKGYNQTPGIDYFETFSPVVKPSTISIVLTIALSSQWII